MDNPLKHTAIDIFDYSGNKVCNLYDSSLSAEGQAYDIVFTNPLGSFPTLTFSMPYVIDDRKNFRWDFIKPEYLIYFRSGTYGDWFVLDIPIHKKNDKSITKEVSCSHIASILKTKNLYMTFDDETGIGTLAYLIKRALKGTLWTFDEEGSDPFPEKDSNVEKVRSFSSDGKEGALQLVTNICTLFNAYPIFDGNTKTITVKALNNKGDIREMYIGKDLTALEVKHDSTSLITRMYVEGSYGDGEFITIDSVNPTGLSYIMDFSYYKELGLFTAEHQAALDKYIHDMNEAVGNVKSVTEELLQREQELSELWGQIDFVYYPIVNGEIDYDNYILGGNATEKDAKISEWDSTVTYNYGDIVFYQGKAYQARVTITPGAVPTDPAYWKEVELHYTILQDNHEYRDQTNTEGITLHDLSIVRFILLPSSTIGGKQVSVESNLQTITTIQEDRAREMNLPNPDMGKIATYDSQIRAYQNRNIELYTGVGTVEFGVMHSGSLDEADNGKEKVQENAIRSDVLTPVRDVTYSMYASANRKLSIFRFDNTSTLISPVLTVENNTSVSIDTDAFDNTQYYRVVIECTDSTETAPVATDATITITHSDGLYSLMERAFNLIVRIDTLSKQRTSSLDSQDEIEVEFATAMGDMLKEGYWNNENYVEGQEQALYDDATEVMDYMCRPDVTYTVSRVSLAGQLGYPTEDLQNNMQVRLYDKELGVNDLVYISKVIEYPDDESKDEVELSNKPISLTGLTLDSVLSRMADLANMLQQKNAVYKRAEAINADGSIYMDRLEGQINIMTNRILSSKSSWYTDDNGNIIFESADGKSAMMLSGDGWMIANGKRQDGTWNWRTAANGTGLTADVITAGFLSADRIAARSITANQLASDVGESLDLSSNQSVKIAVGNGIDQRFGYAVLINSSNGNFISEQVPETTLSPVVTFGGQDITSSVLVGDIVWTRNTGDTEADNAWNQAWLANKTKEITVDAEDVAGQAKFTIDVLVNPASSTHMIQSVSVADISSLSTVEVYLTANQPTIQNYNPNLGGGYTPDWTASPYLTITPSIYVNGTQMQPTSNVLSVTWKRKAGTASESNLVSGETVAQATGVLKVKKNFLGNIASGNLSYICYVTYTNPATGTATNTREEVSFALTRAALNIQSVQITGEQVFKTDKNGDTTPASITLTATASNTTISGWQYKNASGNWVTYPNSGTATTLRVLPGDATFVNNVATIKVNTAAGFSDTYSVYKVVDGTDGGTGSSAPVVFLTNENITYAANLNGQVAASETVGYIVAYLGTEAFNPEVGAATGLPSGMHLAYGQTYEANHSLSYTITVDANATLGGSTQQQGTINIPITQPINTTLQIRWSKVNTGLTGNGISNSVIAYAASDDGVNHPAEGSSLWKDTIAATGIQDGQYLWTRTTVSYTSGSSTPVYSVSRIGRQGEDGDPGRGITTIQDYYRITNSTTAPSDPPTGWKTTVDTPTSENPYLWNCEIITYTDSTTSITKKRIIGQYVEDGEDGKGIVSITEYYARTNSTTEPASGDWGTTFVAPDADHRYVWNYEVVTYTVGDPYTTAKRIIGVYGEAGTDGSQFWTTTTAPTSATSPTRYIFQISRLTGGNDTPRIGDVVLYSYYRYTITSVDTEAATPTVTCTVRQSIRGATGAAGVNTATLALYKRVASGSTAPTIDWTTSITYTFASKAYSVVPTGWSTTIPSGTDPLYITNAVASANTATDTIAYTEWTAPILFSYIGKDGTGVTILGSYNTLAELEAAHPTGSAGDSYIVAGDLYVWSTNTSSWTNVGHIEGPTGPQGAAGAAGLNSATVSLYLRSETEPEEPTGTFRYDFSTGELAVVSGSLGDWTQSIPAGTNPCYVIQAAAISSSSTVNIASTAFSDAVVLVENGTDGKGITKITGYYQINNSDSTPPSSWIDPTQPGQTMPSPTPTNRFMWMYERIDYTSGNPAYVETQPHVVGVYGQKGESGANGLTYGITPRNGIIFTPETQSLEFEGYAYEDGVNVISSSTSINWQVYYNGSYTSIGANSTVTLTRAQLDAYDGGCLLRLQFTYQGVTYTSIETVIDKIDNYQAVIVSSGGDVFYDGTGSTTLTCKLYQNGSEKDTDGTMFTYTWHRLNKSGTEITPIPFGTGKSITVNANQVDDLATFVCNATYNRGVGENLLDLSTFADWTNTTSGMTITFDKAASTVHLEGTAKKWSTGLQSSYTTFQTLPAGTYILAEPNAVSLSKSGTESVSGTFTLDQPTDIKNIVIFIYSGTAINQTYSLDLREVGEIYATQAQFTISTETSITTSDEAPSDPQINQLWMDTSGEGADVLKRWNGTEWVEVTLSQNTLSEIQSSITTNSSAIETLQDQIIHTVTQTQYETDMANKADQDFVITTVQTEIKQTAQQITASVSETVQSELSPFKTEVESWLHFGTDGLKLGKTEGGSESPFTVQLTNTELAFLENNDPVAYINNLALYITSARVTNSLAVGTNEGELRGWFEWTMLPKGLGMKWKSE